MVNLTIIIPVYNAERFIDRCMKTILKQTYQNYEIILINDGSTDSSGEICNSYALRYPKIRAIHQDNKGQSMARNAGLKIAEGKYIGFVDIDDWIAIDMYEHLVNLMEQNNCDVTAMECLVTNKYLDYVDVVEKIEFIENEEIIYKFLHNGIKNSSCEYSLCNKIYKASLFAGVDFDEGNYGEDYLINFRLLSKAKRMGRSSKVGYFYYQRNDSTIHGRLKKTDLALLDNCNKVLDACCKLGDKALIDLAELKLARSYFSLLFRGRIYGVCGDLNNSDIEMLRRDFHKNYFKLLKSNIPFNRKILMTLLLLSNIIKIPYNVSGESKGCG